MKSSVYFGLLQLATRPCLHTLHKSALSRFLLSESSRDDYSQLLSTCLRKKKSIKRLYLTMLLSYPK